MRQLTDSERDYLIAYWFTEPLNNSIAMPERFKEGFIAGLDHRQAEIDRLEQSVDILLKFVNGKITRAELEGALRQ